MPGTFSQRVKRKPLISDPGIHHGTCVTHMPWCIAGSVTRGSRGKRSKHFLRMCNPQFYVSGKRPIQGSIYITLLKIYYQPNGKSWYTNYINAHVDIVSTGPSMDSALHACHAIMRLYWSWSSPPCTHCRPETIGHLALIGTNILVSSNRLF